MKLADDLKPGTYFFYCAVHGPAQTTELTVEAEGHARSSREVTVARRARAEAEKTLEPVREGVPQGGADRSGRPSTATKLKAPFAGLYAPGADHALINEFIPREIRAKVGEPITWTMLGSDHTISFDVPKYFPIVEFGTAKGVRFNPQLRPPAGGAPPLPERTRQRRVPPKFDGGTYDGTGFWSSGLFGAEPVRAVHAAHLASRGRIPYACLLAPADDRPDRRQLDGVSRGVVRRRGRRGRGSAGR